MAQEAGSEASVASTSTTPNWYDIHASSLTSWNHMNSWQPPQNPTSNSSCEEDISLSTTSFTNASNHSGLSADSATDLMGEATENHLWSQVLLSVGNGGDLHNSQDGGENFLEALSSKNLTEEIFQPACDYLKKLDSSWEFTNPTPFNSLEKQMNSYNNGNLIEHEKMTNLSDLVSNWSIAPPEPHMDQQYLEPVCSQIKHELSSPSSYSSDGIVGDRNSLFPPFQRPLNSSVIGYGIGNNNSVTGVNSKYYNGMSDIPWSSTRNLSDFISFGSSLNRPLTDFRSSKPCFKDSDSPNSKKQGHHTTSTRGSGKSMGVTSEGKKKRTEDNSETLVKKSKHESSSASSAKSQVPKVKVLDRITTLQQIVSPFGKTDTASVLLETIKYVKFLNEQVQLLSDPYLRAGINKDHSSWGGLERKEKKELDLKSRGLCLVPISCTPQVYHENTTPDYWMPTYRGCFYR